MTCGIYMILNTVNNKFYIGSSYTVEKRLGSHINALIKNKHHSIYLQRSFKKYKFKSFSFIVIEMCNRDDLLTREQFYLNSLKPEYNIALNSKAPMLGRKHGNKIRELMSKLHKGNKYNVGKKRTPEQLIEMSERRKGWKWKQKRKCPILQKE